MDKVSPSLEFYGGRLNGTEERAAAIMIGANDNVVRDTEYLVPKGGDQQV